MGSALPRWTGALGGRFRPSSGFVGTLAEQWQIMAHELGHNLGLRHHGVNHRPSKDAVSSQKAVVCGTLGGQRAGRADRKPRALLGR